MTLSSTVQRRGRVRIAGESHRFTFPRGTSIFEIVAEFSSKTESPGEPGLMQRVAERISGEVWPEER